MLSVETVSNCDSSRAKSAAFALATGWENYMNSNSDKISSCLSEMRKTAIDVICQFKYADDSVYDSLEKSYINNLICASPDYEEIKKSLDALAAINTDKAVNLLYVFLQGLHQKKFIGMWGQRENQIFPWVVSSLGVTKITSRNIWNLLVVIFRNEKYSVKERLHVKDALVKIKAALSA
ncbi:MAG: hypothetical protein FWD40_01355 [Treponema sp.]|nr:hypothetical protein [Treponema sp.]